MKVGAVVPAVLLGLVGIRSALKWASVQFEAETLRDHVLYSLHVAARTCVWFALAGAFVGLAVLDEPERFRWYLVVPIGLAAVQVLAAIGLWRSRR
jgi:ABC-type spermidine/putrescine transport system permease subunit II